MVYGWAAASEDKRIDFSVGIARFGAILKERDRSSRSGPVRFLEIRRWVSGSSQRDRVCARLDPAGPGVGRGAWAGRIVVNRQWSVAGEIEETKLAAIEKRQSEANLLVVLV